MKYKHYIDLVINAMRKAFISIIIFFINIIDTILLFIIKHTTEYKSKHETKYKDTWDGSKYHRDIFDMEFVSGKILLSAKIDDNESNNDSYYSHIIDHRDMNHLCVIKGITRGGRIETMIVSPLHVLYMYTGNPVFANDVSTGFILYNGFCVIDKYNIPNIKLLFDITTKSHKYLWKSTLHHNTVTTSIYLMWRLMFFDNWKVMVLADKEETAEEIMRKIKLIYRYLPFHIKPGVVKNVERTMRFENESFISIQATTENTSIGFSLNTLYLDEFARIKRVDHKEFLTAVTPTLSTTGGQLIISSTPKGRNYFYDLWLQAIQNPDWLYPIEVKWWQVPGRDEEWKQKQIALIGEDRFKQEYEVEFIGGEELFFDSDSTDIMRAFETQFMTKDIIYNNRHMTINVHPKLYNNIDEIFKNNMLLISIDLAEGKSRDYSVINIFATLPRTIVRQLVMDSTKANFEYDNNNDNDNDSNINKQSFVQVAYFITNKHTVKDFAKITSDFVKYILMLKVDSIYNPQIVIEMNKYGMYFISLLRNEGISLGLIAKTKHSIYSDKLDYGVKITPKSKLDNFLLFRDFVKTLSVIPTDTITINQLLSFERHGDKIRATSKYDDLAMSTVNIIPVITSNNMYKIIITDGSAINQLDDGINTIIDSNTSIGKIYHRYMNNKNMINKIVYGNDHDDINDNVI